MLFEVEFVGDAVPRHEEVGDVGVVVGVGSVRVERAGGRRFHEHHPALDAAVGGERIHLAL